MKSAADRRHLGLRVLVLALFTLTGCTLLPAGEGSDSRRVALEEPTPTPVPTAVAIKKPTYVVARGEVVKQLIIGGRIVPVIQNQLFFRTGGRVRAVLVTSGEMVEAGHLLAELEIADIERELVGSQLDLERARVRLTEAGASHQDDVKRAQANLAIAQENLAMAKAQEPGPRTTKAQVALERAEIARQQAQAAYDALVSREDRDASAEAAALERATWDYQEAQSAYDLALQDTQVYDHRVSIAQFQVELAQITFDGLGRGVDPLLANDVARAQFTVDKLQASVADAQIVAPLAGQVQVAFSLVEGAAVNAFSYVATVSDLAQLEVSVDTIDFKSGQLSEGMPAVVSLVGQPGVDIAGHIRRVPATGVLAGAGRDRSLHISLDDEGAAGYRSGDLVRVSLVLERKPDVLWLAPAAIRTFEGRRFVVVEERDGQRRVDITVGLEGDNRSEILSGLAEGQIVVGP